MNTIKLKSNYGNRNRGNMGIYFPRIFFILIVLLVVTCSFASVPKDRVSYRIPDTNVDWSKSCQKDVYMEYTKEDALMFMVNLFQLNAKEVAGKVNTEGSVLRWKGDWGIWNEVRITGTSTDNMTVKSKVGCIPSFWLDDKLEQRYRDAFNVGTIFNLGQIKTITFNENSIIVDLYVEEIEDILPD